MKSKFIDEILLINKNIIRENVSLKEMNTMRVDAFTKYLIEPTSFMELKKVLILLKKFNLKYYIIGNGSNVIFTSKVKQCIIKLKFKSNYKNNILHANELLPVVASAFLNKGYSGFETLSLIPASIGGAIVMNASAYGKSISEIIEYVFYIDKNLKFRVIEKNKCNFSYRNSIFKGNNLIILGCKVKLNKRNVKEIKKETSFYNKRRILSQPIGCPNSGSIFINPKKYKAWELINKVNLNGYSNGRAKVSEKHSNFIVNYNNASYSDIIEIIIKIQEKVKKEFGIKLKKEIIIID